MLITSVHRQCLGNGSNAQKQVVHQSIRNPIKASLQLHSQRAEHLEINITQGEGSGREECNLSQVEVATTSVQLFKIFNLLHL